MHNISIANIYELCAKDGKEFSLIFQKPSGVLIFEWRWFIDSKIHAYRHAMLINQLSQLNDIERVISDFSNENNWVN